MASCVAAEGHLSVTRALQLQGADTDAASHFLAEFAFPSTQRISATTGTGV
jgi:hypothetical protein